MRPPPQRPRPATLRRPLHSAGPVALALALAACAPDKGPRPPATGDPHLLPIFEATDALADDWQHVRIWGETDWALAALDGEVVIRAVGRGTSSALARWVEIDTGDCPVAEWSWRVDALPSGSELTDRDREDVAASVMFVFGDPGSLGNPKPVPTIRYVWASRNDDVDAIVDSQHFPGTLQSIVVRSGPERLGEWVTERRDLRADYRRAFGEGPEAPVEAFALYTDNDHLEQPTTALYRSARMRCAEAPGNPILR